MTLCFELNSNKFLDEFLIIKSHSKIVHLSWQVKSYIKIEKKQLNFLKFPNLAHIWLILMWNRFWFTTCGELNTKYFITALITHRFVEKEGFWVIIGRIWLNMLFWESLLHHTYIHQRIYAYIHTYTHS